MPSKIPSVNSDMRRALHSQPPGRLEIAGAGSWGGIWASGCRPRCFKEQKALCKCAEICLLFSVSK